MRWSLRTRYREPAPKTPPPTRLDNELAGLRAIRDDSIRVQPTSALASWINGAIFALEWVRSGEPSEAWPPSRGATWMRDGHASAGSDLTEPQPPK